MFYSILFLLFVLMFIISVWSRREYRGLAISMGWVLFLLVALRDINVGSDTYGYVQAFLDPNYMGSDIRDIEGLFKKWQDFWRIILPGGQLYLVVCAFFSVGLVLLSMWKSSSNRIWSYTLFVVAFSWYFYLSGIRQSLAMGCFTYGTYLLCRNINDVLVLKWKDLFRRENLWAIVFLLVSPLFHTTAIFAITVLVLALFSPRNNRTLYMWGIILSFIICLTAVFKGAEQLLQNVVGALSDEVEMMNRYVDYANDDYQYNLGLYLVLKNALPLNFIAVFAMIVGKKEYDTNMRMFFWMVIISNLFFYFSYMFRMRMYFYPAACVAIVNLLWPVLSTRKTGISHMLLILYVILMAYVTSTNLGKIDSFEYHFFF